MRKLLLSLLLILFFILVYFLMLGRISFGNFRILGITDIKDESNKLDQKLSSLERLVGTEQETGLYDEKYSVLNSSSKALAKAKITYEEKVNYSTEQEVDLATRHQIYLIEYLWASVGNYATKEGVTLEMKPTRASTGASKNYDLNFTATGKYTGITDFIASVENDSKLEFIIESFKMIPSTSKESTNENNLVATFVVKNVTIDLDLTSSSVTTQDEGLLVENVNNEIGE